VATYREDDEDPKEEFVNHEAGLGGMGGSSYIDAIVCRDKDENTAWPSASDGVLEERIYYCQNWRADVSALVTAAGEMLEWVKYSAYGIPFALPAGDADSDGDCDATDATVIQGWIDAPSYDVRGDLDLDGDVDSTDKSTAQSNTKTLGWKALSDVGNRSGYAGYFALDDPTLWLARHRALSAELGRWTRRDPAHYVAGLHLYAYVSNQPLILVDPLGLTGKCTFDVSFEGASATSGGGVVCTYNVKINEVCKQKCACKWGPTNDTPLTHGFNGDDQGKHVLVPGAEFVTTSVGSAASYGDNAEALRNGGPFNGVSQEEYEDELCQAVFGGSNTPEHPPEEGTCFLVPVGLSPPPRSNINIVFTPPFGRPSPGFGLIESPFDESDNLQWIRSGLGVVESQELYVHEINAAPHFIDHRSD